MWLGVKHNQKYGKKSSEKRIAPKVIAILEHFIGRQCS
jgi:hypothetical protein